VEIPSGGFTFGSKFKDATIVIVRKKDGVWSLALDNGQATKIAEDGTMIESRARTDERPGGLDWKPDMTYYDGSKVKGVRDLDKDFRAALKLDSGFKVKLDRWGKELARKELEKQSATEDPAPTTAEAPTPDPDLEPKKEALNLLGEWCAKCNGGTRIAPKQAYEKFTGVVIEPGDEMKPDDYAVLRDELQARINDASAA
jgi:hypothetical protein